MDITKLAMYKKMFGGGGGNSGSGDFKITDASYLFYDGARIDSMEQLISAFHDVKTLNYAFYKCQVETVPDFDTSKCENFWHAFEQCSNLKVAPNLDTSNGTTFNNIFSKCSNLTTVNRLDLNKATTSGSTTNLFGNCNKLTDLYLYNIRYSITIWSSTGSTSTLTDESLIHTIKELCTVTSSMTLTMRTVNVQRCSMIYCKIIDDTTEKKPMELCESTDEGAMTLVDYALEKGWSLA